MNLIAARGLTKRFGDHTAVDNVSLTVKRGEVVGFLGPNGAGKSTTMRMISGFLEPDAGSTQICDYDIAERPTDAKRRLGYLPEGAPAYTDMTVAEFLRFVGRVRGLEGEKLDERLGAMVHAINLAEVWNKTIETLSKGFKRRVGIAQALIHDPDVLILDEPTDGLDPNQKHEMRTLIQSIAPQKAIIVSTHILEEVEAVCTRTVIIADGKVVADDNPQDLVAKSGDENAILVSISSGDTDAALSKIAKLTDGERIDVRKRASGGARLIVRANSDATTPADIASALAEGPYVVEEVVAYKPTLEDVFRTITRQQKPN